MKNTRDGNAMVDTRGFTLIELLVVIAIIGMLSSVILASVNTARVKSRDARRLADVVQIRNALELYVSDNTHYPIANSTGVVGDNTGLYWTSFDSPSYGPAAIVNPAASNLTAALGPYLKGTMADPKNLGTDSGYLYIGNGVDYCILIWRTPENMNNFKSHLIPPNRCSAWNSSGQCTTPAGAYNSIYTGIGAWAGGC